MSCDLRTQTIAWAHGEGDESHVHHVVACADCTALLAEHEAVLARVGPVARALAPRARVRWPWALAALAAAAAVVLVWRLDAPPPAPPPPDEIALDAALGGLDDDLATLAADLDDRSAL